MSGQIKSELKKSKKKFDMKTEKNCQTRPIPPSVEMLVGHRGVISGWI